MDVENSVRAAAPDRLRLLVESGIALSSELSLEALLHRLVGLAVELTSARYGALGVIDRTGTALEQFITVGVDDEERATIGDLPHGRGILGVLIRERETLQLHDLSQDPRSVGFPPGHPPMHSFLGVPIRLRGTVFGNLYLTEKQGGDFTPGDEDLVQLLAAQAAVAIENARLYESARQWSRQLESLNEVSEALVTEADLSQLLELAATRLRELLDARVVMIDRPSSDGASLAVEAANGERAEQLVGMRLETARSKAGRAFTRRRSERVDALIDDPEVDQTTPRIVDATSGLFVPLVVRDKAAGIVVAYDKRGADPRFTDADMRIAEAFANRAAIALELADRVGREAVRALLQGQETERARLARELHDETGQALASILLGLKALERDVGEEPLVQLRELVASALGDVRRLTVELRPPALDDFGLQAALERLTTVLEERSGVQTELNVAASSLPPIVETALYRIVQEALTNVVKHAHARSVSVVVAQGPSSVRCVIEDDGQGFSPDAVREGALGLVGMRERLHLLGGRLEIQATPGRGTTLVAELPLDQ
ncbi:MAG: GAF domain-containing protein [Actinobacteria bacterium]|nr:GAF domain-containing protein [Actinomycetota bacterium]MBV8395066.1 GAF domain-containing protein [Actinomycetota bacterium]MBV8598760.1 GAF domain-containing protein [Actinomycetota bacterium]